MAATNRPDILDPALLRPGRFDRQVVVPLPGQSERCAILAVHTKGKRVSGELDLNVVARGTPGMSGAGLSNLVNEAALRVCAETAPRSPWTTSSTPATGCSWALAATPWPSPPRRRS